ncbi:MAG: dihydroneopterin aldolase [Myxococcales bacterium]|nr:dihydroneopterin aldolase [Myxococcales bacterium]
MADVLALTGLEVDCVVGVYPHERGARQRLVVDLEMELDVEAAASQQSLRRSVDYHAMAAQLAFLLQSCEFRLLETAARALLRYVLAAPAASESRAPVQRARVTLTKPGALAGRGVPSVRLERDASWARYEIERKPFGTVDVIDVTREAGIYRLNLAPGAAIPTHVHRVMRESEMILSDGLLLSGHSVPAGAVFRWPHDFPHRYDNPTDRVQTVLCVDTPPFMPDDEVLVDAPARIVPPEPPWLAR